jgi:hypothetical protein
MNWVDVFLGLVGIVVTVVSSLVGYLHGRYIDHEGRIVRLEIEQKGSLSLLQEIKNDVKAMKQTIDRANL